jgi:Ca2+-dependent lipid-binding protein
MSKNNVSDPFVKIYLDDHSNVVAQTKVIQNNLSPIWNEVFYIPIPPRTEKLSIFVFHESNLGEHFLGKSEETIYFTDEFTDK